jgi:hypothetical protein
MMLQYNISKEHFLIYFSIIPVQLNTIFITLPNMSAFCTAMSNRHILRYIGSTNCKVSNCTDMHFHKFLLASMKATEHVKFNLSP